MKQCLSLQSRVRIPDSVLSQNLQGEQVLLNLDSGIYWGLNPIGTRIWQLLLEQNRLDTILKTLLDEYDVTEGRLREDLRDLITRLADNGLIEVVDEGVD